jgi:hypothetical protein
MKALKLNFNLGRRRTMGLPPRPMMHTMASRRYVKSLARGGRIQRQVVIYVITLFVATFASTYLYKKIKLILCFVCRISANTSRIPVLLWPLQMRSASPSTFNSPLRWAYAIDLEFISSITYLSSLTLLRYSLLAWHHSYDKLRLSVWRKDVRNVIEGMWISANSFCVNTCIVFISFLF